MGNDSDSARGDNLRAAQVGVRQAASGMLLLLLDSDRQVRLGAVPSTFDELDCRRAAMKHPAHPRINCCIDGCKRGTTRWPSGEIICGPCWRKVPKAWRRRMALCRRIADTAERKGNEARADRAREVFHRRWQLMKRTLNNPQPDASGLPPTMAEELRREGLL